MVAFRSEEVAADHPFRRIHPSLHLRLTRLKLEDVRLLLESMAGPLPAEAVEVVYRLSEGSPFMASAVLRGMAESGALLADPTGWRIEPLALADLQSSGRAAGFLSRRIELLPHDTLEAVDRRRRAWQRVRSESCRQAAGTASFSRGRRAGQGPHETLGVDPSRSSGVHFRS